MNDGHPSREHPTYPSWPGCTGTGAFRSAELSGKSTGNRYTLRGRRTIRKDSGGTAREQGRVRHRCCTRPRAQPCRALCAASALPCRSNGPDGPPPRRSPPPGLPRRHQPGAQHPLSGSHASGKSAHSTTSTATTATTPTTTSPPLSTSSPEPAWRHDGPSSPADNAGTVRMLAVVQTDDDRLHPQRRPLHQHSDAEETHHQSGQHERISSAHRYRQDCGCAHCNTAVNAPRIRPRSVSHPVTGYVAQGGFDHEGDPWGDNSSVVILNVRRKRPRC
ncbi:hypothetical protein L618_002600000330 [Rhodococcus rhodochrous J45]|uniref:Uncharacterized protein n=1 Tax=Rhodococcus rhodochrous J45 TaxID=935266 RepID=A0A562E2N6_RHORH|nr:hypothetical protein L618_002600000330 [Rhodococcus rhodochrous J45]